MKGNIGMTLLDKFKLNITDGYDIAVLTAGFAQCFINSHFPHFAGKSHEVLFIIHLAHLKAAFQLFPTQLPVAISHVVYLKGRLLRFKFVKHTFRLFITGIIVI